MIVIASMILGALFGALKAKRRGGNRLDMAQYGGVYMIIFTIIGVFVTFAVGSFFNA